MRRGPKITDFSVEQLVSGGVFRFPPPLIDRSPRPKALYLMWRAFQLDFPDIADPRSFPPLPVTPEPDELMLFQRYIAAAEELAESELLCGADRMTVRWGAETGNVQTDAAFTSKEITRGFATLLRQFDSKGEDASFQAVSVADSTSRYGGEGCKVRRMLCADRCLA